MPPTPTSSTSSAPTDPVLADVAKPPSARTPYKPGEAVEYLSTFLPNWFNSLSPNDQQGAILAWEGGHIEGGRHLLQEQTRASSTLPPAVPPAP